MQGPSTVASKPRRKTSPVDARWTTSSAGISSADSAYSWPPSENGSTERRTASRCSSPGRSRSLRRGNRAMVRA